MHCVKCRSHKPYKTGAKFCYICMRDVLTDMYCSAKDDKEYTMSTMTDSELRRDYQNDIENIKFLYEELFELIHNLRKDF